MSKQNETKEMVDRARDYCREGEKAAYYMAGLADAFEAMGHSPAHGNGGIVHHLRQHAHELQMGTLWVEHEYKEGRQP